MSRLRHLLGPWVLGGLHGLCYAPGLFPAWALPWLQMLLWGGMAYGLWGGCTWLRRWGGQLPAWHLGFAFGLGTFLTGTSWIFISLHEFAYMAAPLALSAVIVLAMFLSLFYGLATSLHRYFFPAPVQTPWRSVLFFGATWAGLEWLRGNLFTGFPWLNIGYAHVEGPLQGWAPMLGVYGVALVAALTAGAIAMLTLRHQAGQRLQGLWLLPLALLTAGSLVSAKLWTSPYGAPLEVRLVQANIRPDMKFDPAQIWIDMDVHRQLASQARVGGAADFTLLPETTIPVFQDQLSTEAWEAWIRTAQEAGGGMALGLATRLQISDTQRQYYNSVLLFDAHSTPASLAAAQGRARYDKQHLVPFGEFIPPGFRWFVDAMVMPLGDFNRGPRRQAPFLITDQRIAMNICYEDVFGEELLPAIRSTESDPGATILANVSNLGWFGNTLALPQHLQMARMRVRETGRPMLRATNTGMTAIIAANGDIQAQLPPLSVGVLDGAVQGTTGLTPYTRTGNLSFLLLTFLLLALPLWRHFRPTRDGAARDR